MQSYNIPIDKSFGTFRHKYLCKIRYMNRHKCHCKIRYMNRHKCYSNLFDKSIDIHPDIRPHSHSNSILLLHSLALLWREQA